MYFTPLGSSQNLFAQIVDANSTYVATIYLRFVVQSMPSTSQSPVKWDLLNATSYEERFLNGRVDPVRNSGVAIRGQGGHCTDYNCGFANPPAGNYTFAVTVPPSTSLTWLFGCVDVPYYSVWEVAAMWVGW